MQSFFFKTKMFIVNSWFTIVLVLTICLAVIMAVKKINVVEVVKKAYENWLCTKHLWMIREETNRKWKR